MVGMMVAFCLVCGKRLTNEEIEAGIKRGERGKCAICHLKEGPNGTDDGSEVE